MTIRFIILIVSILLQSSIYIHAEKILFSDSSKSTQILREGDISRILNDIKNSPDLQLERLAAYFFHQRINQYRLDNGLTTLYWDDRMWLAARNHNVYMTKTKYGHEETKGCVGFTGITPSDRIQFVTYNGFKMSLYGENILMNFSAFYQRSIIDNAKNIADESFEMWRKSPPHNKNMLDPVFFAEGTSFYRGSNGVSQIFGTSNFGNASDFVKNEICISWNTDLAKQFPPMAEVKRKQIKPAEWSLESARKEILNVVKTNMPKSKSVYNADFELAALMGMEGSVENDSLAKKHTKLHYIKVAKNPKLKLLLSRLYEHKFRFNFTIDQLISKSALSLVDEQLKRTLPSVKNIETWGGKCTLIEKNTAFICDIDLIYVIQRK